MSELPWRVKPYVEMLNAGQSFSQANYGDGEWSCILDEDPLGTGKCAQGSDYTDELKQALIKTLVDPRFTFFGTNPGKLLRREAEEWCVRHNIGFQLDKPVRWVNKEMLPAANVRGQLGPFIAAIRKRKVLLVGPSHLRKLKLFQPAAFVEVPFPNSFRERRDTALRIGERIRDAAPTLIVVSAGMAGKVTIWDVVKYAQKFGVSILDCGAIWDPYVGENSRRLYRKPEFQEAMRKNIEEADKWA